jgi:hypothetical protein
LPDDVAQLPLKIGSTGILEGLQHVLSINCPIALSIELSKSLQDNRCKKKKRSVSIFLNNSQDECFFYFIVLVERGVHTYYSKNK